MVLFLLAFASIDYDQQALLSIAHSAIAREVHGLAAQPQNGRTPARPVFVTIERNGKVLGCRGSLDVQTTSLEQEVAFDARAAAGHDPRYRPIEESELGKILVTITIVNGLETIQDVSRVTASDGIVLRSGDRVGVVLPWEGKDPNVRLGWAYRKAGVDRSSPASLQKLIGERFRG